MSQWLHADINSYFATMLQQENPALRGRPVGVVKSAGRTCVIAASKEAKKLGVATGCSKYEALQLAPDIVFVPAHFAMCLDATRRLNRLFKDTVPNVEIFSLDESFLDLRNCERLIPDPVALAERLRDRIKADLGEWVTCNIGIAPNRFLAKMASEIMPKGSITLIGPDDIDPLLMRAPLAAACGIGARLGAKLNQLGVTAPYGINLLSDEDLLVAFGPYWSKELRIMGRGEEPSMLARGVDEAKLAQSVGRSITGYKPTSDTNEIRRILYNLTAEVCYKARKMHLSGRQVSVYLSNKQGKSWGAHHTLATPIRHTQEMFDWIFHQLYAQWPEPFPVIKFGVSMSLLEPWGNQTEPLWQDWQKRESVAKALDTLTERFGLYSVRPAVLASREELIRPEVTGYLGDKSFWMHSQ